MKSQVQNDAELGREQSATKQSSSLNSNVPAWRAEGSGKLKLKDSPGIGYPTLGRPWALGPVRAGRWVGTFGFLLGRQGSQGKAALELEWKFRARLQG